MTKAQAGNMACCKVWQDFVIFNYSSLSATVSADGILLGSRRRRSPDLLPTVTNAMS
jgi:hypothetical protein